MVSFLSVHHRFCKPRKATEEGLLPTYCRGSRETSDGRSVMHRRIHEWALGEWVVEIMPKQKTTNQNDPENLATHPSKKWGQ